jgi:hypothetical protein
MRNKKKHIPQFQQAEGNTKDSRKINRLFTENEPRPLELEFRHAKMEIVIFPHLNEACAASYPMGTRGSFPGGKAAGA